MRGLKPTVEHRAPQLDEIREHIRRNQFVYGMVAGFILSRVLTPNQTINVVIPREKY